MASPTRTGALCIALTLLLSCAATNARTDPNTLNAIRQQIEKYRVALNAADIGIASQVWRNSPDVSFIHPGGHAHGWDEVKGIYEFFGKSFSDRKLTLRDIAIHTEGQSAWAEFYWSFDAKTPSGQPFKTEGRETQVYINDGARWQLVHVHYSGPAAPPASTP